MKDIEKIHQRSDSVCGFGFPKCLDSIISLIYWAWPSLKMQCTQLDLFKLVWYCAMRWDNVACMEIAPKTWWGRQFHNSILPLKHYIIIYAHSRQHAKQIKTHSCDWKKSFRSASGLMPTFKLLYKEIYYGGTDILRGEIHLSMDIKYHLFYGP